MITLTNAEEKLASLIWQSNLKKIPSPALVDLAHKKLGWKKSTTYTVLKKLCDKGVLKNENALVEVLLTHDELIAHQSRGYVANRFGGSLPRFLTAFIGGGELTQQEADELKCLIDAHSGKANGGTHE